MKTATLATAALLTTLSTAATVTLKTTDFCIQHNTELEEFTVPIGELTEKELEDVCGIEILGADGADASTVICQAFKDEDGEEPGSANFTKSDPALISTNPVQLEAIWCRLGANSTTQVVGASTADVTTLGTVVSTGTAVSSGTGGLAPTGGNSTVPSMTGGPTAQPTNPSGTQGAEDPEQTDSAATRGFGSSVLAVAGAFAAALML